MDIPSYLLQRHYEKLRKRVLTGQYKKLPVKFTARLELRASVTKKNMGSQSVNPVNVKTKISAKTARTRS